MREVIQIARFYEINKFLTNMSVETFMNNLNYNPLLKKCIETVKRHPDWAIDECRKYRNQIDKRKFKFDSGTWAMDIREEDLPAGIIIDMFDLKAFFLYLIEWVTENREKFTKEIQMKEKLRNS